MTDAGSGRRTRRHIVVRRYSVVHSGWLAKLLVVLIALAVVASLLLFFLGLWLLLAVALIVAGIAAIVSISMPRMRLGRARPGEPLEGESVKREDSGTLAKRQRSHPGGSEHSD